MAAVAAGMSQLLISMGGPCSPQPPGTGHGGTCRSGFMEALLEAACR